MCMFFFLKVSKKLMIDDQNITLQIVKKKKNINGNLKN